MELKIQNVSMTYPSGKRALRGLDLELRSPSLIGLLGPNGAGKSTLMRLLAAALLPTQGRILVDGAPLEKAEGRLKASLGYLPQDFGLFDELTVTQFLDYMAALKGLKDPKTAIREAVAAVGLEEKARAKIRALSGGQRQRVGIAQALLGDPPFLLFDEPAVGLARDCPSDERVWWRDQMEISRRALARLLQAPRRALDGACVLTRRNARMDPRGLHQLDEYQLDELDALLQDEEIAIFCRDSAGALPVRRFRARRAAADQAVRTLMGRRMTRARALAAGFAALGVYLLGFVPELLRAARQDAGMDSLLAACGVRLGVLALAGILALLYFRRGLLNMIGDYNGVMNHIRARVAESCQFFSDYLSQVCGYMRGRSIRAALQGRSRLAREGLHQLEKHRRAIARCCGRTGDWMRDFGLDVLPDERLGQMEYFNSDIDPEENEAYDLRASREGFIEDREGKRLRVPYPFVRSLEIGREDLSQ